MQSLVALEEIDGAEDFANSIDRIDPPNQIISALNDSLLQKYIVLTDNQACTERLNDWLALFLDAHLQGVISGQARDSEFREVLQKVLSFTRSTKVLPSFLLLPSF